MQLSALNICAVSQCCDKFNRKNINICLNRIGKPIIQNEHATRERETTVKRFVRQKQLCTCASTSETSIAILHM